MDLNQARVNKMFKKRKKEPKYQTDLTIYEIFHIKAPEPASVFIVLFFFRSKNRLKLKLEHI